MTELDESRADEPAAPPTQDEARDRHMHHGLHRPPWKRVVLTLVGLALFLVGTFLWLLPAIPGGFLAYLGIPLMFAASPRHEVMLRRWISWRVNRARVRFRRWRRERA